MSGPATDDPLTNLHNELGKVFINGSNKWSTYNSECLLHRKKPVLGTVNQKEIEEKAREKCKDRMGTQLFLNL
jgi:hypothetical protein